MKKRILVKDLLNFLNHFAPPQLAETWDNIGLQIGNEEEEVRGVLVALDVTEETLKEALNAKCNVLITHHPLFFKAVKQLGEETINHRLIKMAVRQDIQIMSAHTNLDSAPHGLNDLLAEKLKLKFVHPLIAAKEDKTHQAGLGRVGRLPKLLFSEFLDFLSFQLKLKQFRYVGDLNKLISTVAVMSGSGGDFYHHAKLKKADVLVSGDVKYHAALDALGEGICLVDIGHFAGEFGMVSLIANQIRQFLKKQRVFIPVTETLVQQDPFSFRINS